MELFYFHRLGFIFPSDTCTITFFDLHQYGIYLIILIYMILLIFVLLFAFAYKCSLTKSCLTLCNPMDCSTPGFPVHHQLLEFIQTHVHWVSDAIQPSHPVIPFSSRLQSFLALGSLQMSQFFPSGGQSIGVSALTSVLPMNIQD